MAVCQLRSCSLDKVEQSQSCSWTLPALDWGCLEAKQPPTTAIFCLNQTQWINTYFLHAYSRVPSRRCETRWQSLIKSLQVWVACNPDVNLKSSLHELQLACWLAQLHLRVHAMIRAHFVISSSSKLWHHRHQHLQKHEYILAVSWPFLQEQLALCFQSSGMLMDAVPCCLT